jgi:hypothetical protein
MPERLRITIWGSVYHRRLVAERIAHSDDAMQYTLLTPVGIEQSRYTFLPKGVANEGRRWLGSERL